MFGHLAYLVTSILYVIALGAVDPTPIPSRSPVSDAIDSPVFLFFETPASLDAFWARLKTPDFVLLRGARYQSLLNAGGPPLVRPLPEATISRVAIRGSAGPRIAELSVEYEISLRESGAQWVPLKLEGFALITVKEGGRTLPVRYGPALGWEIEIAGKGNHTVEVNFVAPVVSNGEERRLGLSIPLAATTTLALIVSEDPIEASLGTLDPIVPIKVPGLNGTRLDASMTPRSKLDLIWRIPAEQSTVIAPILSAQGEIGIDVSPDSIRSRVHWTVTAVRGTSRELTFSFDPAEDLLDLELDNRSLAIDTLLQGQLKTFTIVLTEPLRQGSPPRNVALTTRRKITPQQVSTVDLKGYALKNATLQSGALALTQSGSIWVEGVVGRGLVRIDPANGLPVELRSRPGTILGYRFVEQPFDLRLKIEPSPPLLEARASTTLTLLPAVASADSEFQFRATPGQIFNLRFRIPRNIVLEPIGVNETVEASNLEADARNVGPRAELTLGRILNIRLTSRAREAGVFTVKLRSRQPWSPGPDTSIALCQPLNTTSLGGRLSLRHWLGIVIDPELTTKGPIQDRVFQRDYAPASTDGAWPDDPSPGLDSNRIWLNYEGLPQALPLSTTILPRSIRSESLLTARATRTGVEYREFVHLDVLNGLLAELDLVVPPEVDRDWDVEGSEVASRELRETAVDGSRRYRLILSKGSARALDFRLRYRSSYRARLERSKTQAARFSKIQLLPEVEGAVHFAYDSDPGITLAVNEDQKKRHLMPSLSWATTEPKTDRLVMTQPSGAALPEYTVSAEPLLALPGLVVSRTYLRTLVGSDELRTTATFLLDVHGPDIVVNLPVDARWIEAKMNGQIVSNFERIDGTSRYRLQLPITPVNVPTLMTLEYSISYRSKQSWASPRIEESVCQTVYWEIVVPTQTALLGVPVGWSDENRWYWDKFVWMRKPAVSSTELRKWSTVSVRLPLSEIDDSPLLSTGHSYLFRRTDGLFPIPVVLASRVMLLGLCSGVAGLIGIVLVLLRPSYRFMTIPLGILFLVVAVGWDPNVTFQVLQSGSLGLLLAVLAAGLQKIVDRRGSRTRRMSEPTGSILTPPQVFTTYVAPVGSDDSTAIRGRRQSTADRILIAPPLPPEADTASHREV